jgi:hypothetical protein
MWGVEGDKTVGISDTFLVTANGCESFFTLDRDFVVKPGSGKAAGDKPAGGNKQAEAAPLSAVKTNGKNTRNNTGNNEEATHAESD